MTWFAARWSCLVMIFGLAKLYSWFAKFCSSNHDYSQELIFLKYPSKIFRNISLKVQIVDLNWTALMWSTNMRQQMAAPVGKHRGPACCVFACVWLVHVLQAEEEAKRRAEMPDDVDGDYDDDDDEVGVFNVGITPIAVCVVLFCVIRIIPWHPLPSPSRSSIPARLGHNIPIWLLACLTAHFGLCPVLADTKTRNCEYETIAYGSLCTILT